MKSQRTLADPRLTQLLTELLGEENLPPLDRWFAQRARKASWNPADQKRLWDALRRALARAYGLLEESTPEATMWSGVRSALRGRVQEWAIRADLPQATETLAEAGIPGWLASSFAERGIRSAWTTDETARFLEFQEEAAPVHVRFRQGLEGDAVRRQLEASHAIAGSDVDGIDRLAGGPGLEGSEAWKKGLVEIQDASSQLSLRRLGLRPGMRVWDVCAGQGGKTLLAAGELRGKGALVATDVAEFKLKTLKDRVRRSGWQNIRVQHWDGETLPEFGPEVAARGGFDRVIVDAPCTASGTWRRDPEARFRLSPRTLKEVNRHQSRLIRLAWAALRPHGQMAYITCSWLPEENEAIVEDFTNEVEARVLHQELLGLPSFDANTLFVCLLEKP